ncbi:MAG TPA: methyltransferase [Gaiellaceae bacterium]
MTADRSRLAGLVNGFRTTSALYVVALLGLADLLAVGPRTSEDLAAATGTDADALYRLLRALATVGVFEEQPGRRFALTAVGDGLRSDVEGSLRPQVLYLGRPHQWHVWTDLLHSVRTGTSAFEHQHGESAWAYRAQRPDESALFDDWMTAMTRAANAAIVAGYDFSRFDHIVDVAGGHGAFLSAILDASPETTGTLFDQEHVVAGAPAHPRIQVAAGSFFEAVPRGGDAYVLKSIVHDWPDAEATAILRTCAAALGDDGRVLLVERDLDDPTSVWIDLQMLVMFGARERTADEYARLFEAAGLRFVDETKVGGGWAVYQGAATSPSR